MKRTAFVFAGLVMTAAAVRHDGDNPARFADHSVWDSVYTLNQAARGETAYTKACARCHKASLAGGDESPPLVGSAFLANWNEQSVGVLHDRVRSSMPSDDPGTLSREIVTDVIAYMLKANGFPAGAADLPTDAASLKAIVVRASKP